MKARVFLLAILIIVLVAGCAKPEQPRPTIAPIEDFTSAKVPDVPTVTSEPAPDGIKFLGINFAAEGDYIIISFLAPPSESRQLWQDSVFVIDETTKAVYKDIPVMPIIGPLVGYPATEGQTGYVTLVNYNKGLKSGAKVTVILGKYKREHIIVP